MTFDLKRRNFLKGAAFGVGTFAFSGLGSNAFGGIFRSRDICDRSATVVKPLEKAIAKACGNITEGDLAYVSSLSLPHIHLPGFRAGDFVGLTSLKSLDFYSLFHKPWLNPESVAIDEHAFDPLKNLETLTIQDDDLGDLPDGVFSGLVSLKTLTIEGASLSRLPLSLLSLPKIESVYYDGDGMPDEDYQKLKDVLGEKLKPSP